MARNQQLSSANMGYTPMVKSRPSGPLPWRWRAITSAVTGMNAWFGHSRHLILGLSQTRGTHSLAQAGA